MQTQTLEALKSLTESDNFAVLAVRTKEGETVIRPIGGKWGAGIREAVEEVAEKYPGCVIRLFKEEYDYRRYFEGIVPQEQVLPYADYPEEMKKALTEVMRKLGLRED